MHPVGARSSATGQAPASVTALAEQLHLPVEEVASAYVCELARLESEARIHSFVSVLALAAVRTRLRGSDPTRH